MIQRRTQGSVLSAVVSLSLLLAGGAQAIGFGAYFEYDYGNGSTDIFSGAFGDFDHFDENRFGVGFAMDTAVASDRLFNYRLNFGYQYTDRDYDPIDLPFWGNDRHGLMLNNIFGFGVYRDSNMRFWLGPSIRLNVDFLTDMPDDTTGLDVGIGGGIALGLNWHTGNLGSVGITLGYQYLYAPTIFLIQSESDEDQISDQTFDGRQHLVGFNLTYLFRSAGDRFFLGRKR